MAALKIGGNQLEVDSSATILAGGRDIGASGSADAYVRTTVQIGTDGPLRDGIAKGNFYTGFLSNGAGGYAMVSADPDYFAPNFLIGFGYPRRIELGTPLTLTVTDISGGGAGFGDEAAGGGPSSSLFLDFYEADGITPVAIADVPEPRWASALSGGLGMLLILTARRKRCTPQTEPLRSKPLSHDRRRKKLSF